MQPEPTAVSQSSSTDLNPANPPISSQYGHDPRRDESVFDTLSSGGVEDRAVVDRVDDEVSPSPGGVGSGDSLLRRLNSVDSVVSAPTSPIRSVSDFSSPSRVFQPSSADAKSKVYVFRIKPRPSLADLPNEVLTHILSHLPPNSLTAISLVSRRFHTLVTTPHAWRVAFARFFPGPRSIEEDCASDELVSDKRSFTRLTALASWRSEYILRTRLLRSLGRGKPTAPSSPGKHHPRAGGIQTGSPVITYTSKLLYPVSHVDAIFTPIATKKPPLFIHGAAEQGAASTSDPSAGKTGSWGFSSPLFQHFADLYEGEIEYGLGPGDMIGLPNSMDVSQLYGMAYGEGCPQGRSYFISSGEQRGRFLSFSELDSEPDLGIPALNMITTAVSSVWIAKSPNVLKMTNGMVGILCGTSSGILTAYALGTSPVHDYRFDRGQVTARWVLSPGVPIISIAVDENYSTKRHSKRRIWATVLNALGEVYYLTEIPAVPEAAPRHSAEEIERLAWKSGRSIRWEMIEATRRVARPDPYNRELVDGSYSPRSSGDSVGLSKDQIAAETKEIEKFLSFKPKHFRKVCEGWDMRRQLQVDFASDDMLGVGESIVVVNCGLDNEQSASIHRYVRQRLPYQHETVAEHLSRFSTPKPVISLFGGPSSPQLAEVPSVSRSRDSNHMDGDILTLANTMWKTTDFVFDNCKSLQLTSTAMDMSMLAQLTTAEDPLLGMSGAGASTTSSPLSSPLPHMNSPGTGTEVPGQRARLLAVGTTSGSVYVWNMRAPTSRTSDETNSVAPVRIIRTESPQISCLALTSLYLVHGGNDGLVQAWDPLASTIKPIRTLHSRFSSRARRRLIQAEASILGTGNNFFAAGAICLDPDPTVLRGVMSLGTHVRYWSYSSSAADEYKSNKRRLRRSHRGSLASGDGQRFTSTGRGALKDFIEDEQQEMKLQVVEDRKQRERLSNRFGTDILGPGATEEELMAYAQMLSEESWNSDVVKRRESESSTVASSVSSDTIAPQDSSFPSRDFSSSSSPVLETVEEELAPDIAEAIRLSLLDETSSSSDYHPAPSNSIPIKYAKGAKVDKHEFKSPDFSPPAAERSSQKEMDDLEFAIQLSLAEEQSREQAAVQQEEEFPALISSSYGALNKGKGKARAW
ncbi:F-box and WD domain protein [Talaromyces proteolyticus]|uniref:F-box and WD domain protein n=1 Tax=Talaromyces proteolyticus TaxID=1131652 RepID=A0AAD4KRX3_9EURO|nr:F-box and WD domain protein [Talaromyces proteolyticus]KAH8697880.1 F-box and WD domain protein [Talaromyces proteolyticus]